MANTTPKEPVADPTAPKKTAKPKASADAPEAPRQKREQFQSSAHAKGHKVSPRFAFTVHLDPHDGYVYGPFEVETTDETDAKRMALDKCPNIKGKAAVVKADIVKKSEKPTNWDALSEDAQKRFHASRARAKLEPVAIG